MTQNNPPAFPGIKIISERIEMNNYKDKQVPYKGMTLRDYFAGKLLPAIFAAEVKLPGTSVDSKILVSKAYLYADAMLKEREVKQ